MQSIPIVTSAEVLKWFNNIQDKGKHKFMMFDIKDFYPSISEKLLTKSIKFAKTVTNITNKEIEIIFHARKSLLFENGESWVKKGNNLFDVTMGAFDGAEVCELVGCFLLTKLSKNYDSQNIGLYRDDGLAIFKNKNGQQMEKIKKEFQNTFNVQGLEIIIENKMKAVNYLDVTLDLNNSEY